MIQTFYKCILLTGALILVGAPVVSYAQGNLENRLNRLENEIETLGRAVYRGEQPSSTTNYVSSGSSNAADLEVRFQQLESQLRDLTGQVEQQAFDKQQMLKRLESLEAGQAQQAQQWGNTMRAQEQQQPAAPAVQQQTPPQPQPQAQAQTQTQTTTMRTVRPLPSSDAAGQYEQAFAYIKTGDYGAAESAFNSFLETHPDHALTPNAMYWLAESYYVRDQYDKAAKAFADAYQKYPGGPKGADNLLKLGMSLSGLGKTEEACIALSQLAREYPAGPTTILRRGEQESDRLNCR